MAKKRFTAAQVISNGLTAPWLIGLRHQIPNSPGRKHWILSLGVEFKWSRI